MEGVKAWAPAAGSSSWQLAGKRNEKTAKDAKACAARAAKEEETRIFSPIINRQFFLSFAWCAEQRPAVSN
jgi:hypothetical protein